VALLPRYTPTGTLKTLFAPTFTAAPSAVVGTGWNNPLDKELAYVYVKRIPWYFLIKFVVDCLLDRLPDVHIQSMVTSFNFFAPVSNNLTCSSSAWDAVNATLPAATCSGP